MYVCMYVLYMYCMFIVCVYPCTVRVRAFKYWYSVNMCHVCMYVCMYVCINMYVMCMFTCMYSIYIYKDKTFEY